MPYSKYSVSILCHCFYSYADLFQDLSLWYLPSIVILCTLSPSLFSFHLHSARACKDQRFSLLSMSWGMNEMWGSGEGSVPLTRHCEHFFPALSLLRVCLQWKNQSWVFCTGVSGWPDQCYSCMWQVVWLHPGSSTQHDNVGPSTPFSPQSQPILAAESKNPKAFREISMPGIVSAILSTITIPT